MPFFLFSTNRSIQAQQIGHYEDARLSLQRFFDYSLHYSLISLFPYSSLNMALLQLNFRHREEVLHVSSTDSAVEVHCS